MGLGRRIILTTGSLVVIMGLITVGLLQAIISSALGQQLDEKGLATSRVLANDLTNPLLDGDELVVGRNLQRFLQEGSSVVYAYALTPDQRQVIHTFSEGFPAALLEATRLAPDQQSNVRFLETEKGRVRDYGVRVLEGLDAEVHVGFAEDGIIAARQRVTLLIFGLTAAGVAVALVLSWVLGRYVVGPLEQLTAAVEEIGEGRLDQVIPVTSDDEVGELAGSFNRMVVRLREAMEREKSRNRELRALNAVTKVVSLGEDLPHVFKQALHEVVEVLGLRGAWILLTPARDSQSGELAAAVGIEHNLLRLCSCQTGGLCSCWQMIKDGNSDYQAVGVSPDCRITPSLDPTVHIIGPIPLSYSGKNLGFLNVMVDRDAAFSPHDHEMLYAIGRQLGGAFERTQLWHRLLDREDRVSQLLQKVIDAQEEERQRIARELHDETSQSMAALTVGLKAAASLVKRDPERAETLLVGLKEATAHTLREIHNVVYDLRPTLLDDRGLVPALQWYASQRLSSQGVAIEVGGSGLEGRLPSGVETILFRIGQEAITNVAKHARARNLRISVRTEDNHARLSVADDGCGFHENSESPERREKRPLGLVGMVERASLVGGYCRINSLPGEGTRIDVVIPLGGGPACDSDLAGR